MTGISAVGMGFVLPNLFSIPAIETKNRLRTTLGIGGGKINQIADNRGRTVATARNRSFPGDVFCFAPLKRRILAGSSDAIARWAAPRRPIERWINCG